ncbi:MAG TPA: NUDIX domain-containing protein [Anaerolineales bacterium]|nr:NUDIX domain-containing protein [Anaerolineales bacterium]
MRNRAAAIIVRNEKLLLIHRQKPGQDYYKLPGGGVEFDESVEEACIREVKEETGLDVLSLQLVYKYLYRGSEEVCFVVRVPPEEPVLGGSEAKRHSPTNSYTFEWVDAAQLAEINLLPAAARRICLEILDRQKSGRA